MSDELRRNVRMLWDDPKIRRRAWVELFSKIPVAFGLVIGCYAVLMVYKPHWYFIAPLLGGVAIGTIIMGGLFHDANHRATFTQLGLPKVIDGLFAWIVSDVMIGISGYFWAWKHDLHHANSNILHLDQDIHGAPFMQLHPSDTSRTIYKYQHFYVWLLYPFLLFPLQITGIKFALFGGQYGLRSKPRAHGWKFAGAIIGPVVFYAWALVLPWWLFGLAGLLGFLGMMGVVGFAYAVIFQLAHCVESVDYPTIEGLLDSARQDGFVHQLQTTTNFCPNNRLLAYLFGNLTHQNEHHLFWKYPHSFYPYMVPVVREWCRKYQVPYHVKPTLRSALVSHLSHLRTVGAQGQFLEIEMG